MCDRRYKLRFISVPCVRALYSTNIGSLLQNYSFPKQFLVEIRIFNILVGALTISDRITEMRIQIPIGVVEKVPVD